MSVEIFSRKNDPVSPSRLRKGMEALLRYAGCTRAYLEVNLVGPQTIKRLNRVYRGKARLTDVLSFPLENKPATRQGPWVLGGIVIATSVAKNQAKRAKRRVFDQVMRLAVHGLVHLQGLDHEKNSSERKRFERMEKKYLTFLDRKGMIRWDGLLQF